MLQLFQFGLLLIELRWFCLIASDMHPAAPSAVTIANAAEAHKSDASHIYLVAKRCAAVNVPAAPR